MKPQTYNVAYNLKKNVWAISALASEKLQIWCLQRNYSVDVKMPFYLIFKWNVYEAYSRNLYIPATVEVTNNDPAATIHKLF